MREIAKLPKRHQEALLRTIEAFLSRPGAATPEEIREWINARVEARYQRVHEVMILDDFPRSAAGKTLKRILRDRFRPGGTSG